MMGREVRRVPADWEHPRSTVYDGDYRPLFDQDYISACDEWYAEASLFKPTEFSRYYHEYAGDPPDEKFYRPAWTPESATHYQMYETVTEGTPVSPVFATPEALVDYLVNKGDRWGEGAKYDRARAEGFVKAGWAPTFILVRKGE